MRPISYKRALQEIIKFDGSKNLLLGNGFSLSMGYNNSPFNNNDYKKFQKNFQGKNFEEILEVLENTKVILRALDTDLSCKQSAKTILSKIIEQKNSFIKDLLDKHPDRGDLQIEPPTSTKDGWVEGARLLFSFQNYYTTNYDLILYWLLLYLDEKKVLSILTVSPEKRRALH